MIVPLKEGDSVAVVATAKRLEKSIAEGIKVLESWGLNVQVGPHTYGSHEYFAATDFDRLEDLQQALDNPEIKAVIFARGGYGTTRILDQIDFSTFQTNPKWVVGFSDLTSFLLQTGSLGIPAIHGPMAYTLGNDQFSDELLRQLLFGETSFKIPLAESQIAFSSIIEGKITGGNLSLIYESIGAANEIQTVGSILFLEEIGEDFYAVDRMLNKLKRVGKLAQLQGLIVGDFTNVKDSNGYYTRTLKQIIQDCFLDLDIPVVFGFPGGHEKVNYPLLFHSTARISLEERRMTIEYLDQKSRN